MRAYFLLFSSHSVSRSSAMNDPKHRQMILAQETQQLIKKTQEQIKEKSKVKRQFFKASSITYVKPMFQVSWHPILISFGLILDETEVILLLLFLFLLLLLLSFFTNFVGFY
jgi:hypothetical protein